MVFTRQQYITSIANNHNYGFKPEHLEYFEPKASAWLLKSITVLYTQRNFWPSMASGRLCTFVHSIQVVSHLLFIFFFVFLLSIFLKTSLLSFLFLFLPFSSFFFLIIFFFFLSVLSPSIPHSSLFTIHHSFTELILRNIFLK